MKKDPSEAYFEHRRVVVPDDLDELEHVNNAVYLSYAEACARAHAEEKGFTLDTFRASGVLPVVRRHEIIYYRPAELNDVLTVSTEIIKLGGAKATRHTKVRLDEDGALLVEVFTDWVWLAPESGRPRRVPKEVLKAFGF